MRNLRISQDTFEDPSNKKCETKSKIFVKKVPPDGGWGWMVVIGSFLGLILGTFPVFSFSIIFSPILMSREVSSTKISWIYNVHSLVWSLTVVFVGPLSEEFGWRKVALFGGMLNSLSVFLSSFAPNPDYLFFSFSLLGGIGGSCALSLGFLVVSRYFERHRGFALGVTTLGACLSSFLAPIVANYLLEHYGYFGASLIFGAIVLNQCVGASLYHPVEWHMKYEKTDINIENNVNEKLLEDCNKSDELNKSRVKYSKEVRKLNAISAHSTESFCQSSVDVTVLPTLVEKYENNDVENMPKTEHPKTTIEIILKSTYDNIKSLKFMRVKFIAIGYCGLLLGYINFQMWIPFVVTNAGYSLEMAAWCTSLASMGNLLGRIVMSLFSDRKFFNVRYGFMFGLLLIGISIIAFSLVSELKFYMISSCAWGLGIGSAMALHIMVMIDVMNVEMLPAVLGVSSLLKGFGGLPVGILAGVIRDATSSYTYALWMLGGCELMSLLVYLLMPCAEVYDRKKYSKNEEANQTHNC